VLALLKFRFEKKHKYLIQAGLVIAFIYLCVFGKAPFAFEYRILAAVLLVIVGTLITQYPNIDLRNFLYIILMPTSLLVGALLFFHFFPNLAHPAKYIAIAGFGFFYYLVSLVDNIFLVIQDREETIPLYRAATAWSQILQVMVAIPLFSGVFKLDVNGLVQSLLVGFVSFVFVLYQIWTSRYDKDAKNSGVGEVIYLSLLVFFFVTAMSMVFSFVPTEAFLRALMVTIILMFGLSYVASYLRNDITRKMITQFALMFFIFLLVLLLFIP